MWTASAGTWTRFSKRNKYNKRIAFPEMNRSLSSRQMKKQNSFLQDLSNEVLVFF